MKIYKLVVMSLVAILAISLMTTSVIADEKPKTDNGVMEISEYEEYLLEKSKEDSGALEILEQFRELTHPEQRAFLEILASDEYLKMLGNEQIDSNQQFTKTVTATNGVKIPITLKSNDQTNSKKHSSINGDLSPSGSLVQPMATYTAWARGGFDLYIGNIKTSRYYTKLTWEHNGYSATRVLEVEHHHYNYNPGIWTEKHPATGKYVSSGMAHGTGNWVLRATGSAGFVSADLAVKIKARTASEAYKKRVSTHPNIGSSSWIRFLW